MLAACVLGCAARGLGGGSDWRVWLEPKFTRSPASAPIASAQRTELAGGTFSEDGPAGFALADWQALGLAWDDFFPKARANAAADLATLKPSYVRDRRRVIEYAVLHSEQPIVASAVLAPKFLDLFADTLGPKVLVAVPNRFTAYVFPALVSNYRDYAPAIHEAWRATAWPVSLEIFEFSAQGIRTVGIYEEP